MKIALRGLAGLQGGGEVDEPIRQIDGRSGETSGVARGRPLSLRKDLID